MEKSVWTPVKLLTALVKVKNNEIKRFCNTENCKTENTRIYPTLGD